MRYPNSVSEIMCKKQAAFYPAEKFKTEHEYFPAEIGKDFAAVLSYAQDNNFLHVFWK